MSKGKPWKDSRIDYELKARGVADVVVFMRPALRGASGSAAASVVGNAKTLTPALKKSAGTSAMKALSKHFVSSDASPRGALERAIALRVAAEASAGTPTHQAAKTVLRASVPQGEASVRYFPRLGAMLGTVDRDGWEGLRGDDRVESVRPVPTVQLIHPRRVKAASLTTELTWGLRALRIPELWESGLRGEGVRIGHLDTGVDGSHPALDGAIAAYGHFDDLGLLQPVAVPFDTGEHGTHTAGTLVGRAVGGKKFGVAPEAQLVSASVIEGGDVFARVLGGMDWMLGQRVHVLSMSLGLGGWVEDFRDLTRILRDAGVLPVFAIGNEGVQTSRSPGNYPEALSVGAVDRNWRVAEFSSSHTAPTQGVDAVPDLTGPGVSILSCVPAGGYAQMDGTSMATPHIAGLAALLVQHQLQEGGAHDIDEIEGALLASCSLHGQSKSRVGRGTPDGVLALEQL